LTCINVEAVISVRLYIIEKYFTRQEEVAMSITAEHFNLAEAVGYQKGAVVSKTVLDKKIGTITLFSFDAGQGLSEHTAPFDAAVQVIEGEALITVAGTDYRVNSGEFIIMPANHPHSLRAETPFKMMLIMIRA
jgi:quercetin dioxygenase-like cupin family protein